MIHKLFDIIQDRKANPKPGSYTNSLFEAGNERMAQKVGEEAIEVVIASSGIDKQRLVEESADLIYHLWVLLVSQEIPLSEEEKELTRRHSE